MTCRKSNHKMSELVDKMLISEHLVEEIEQPKLPFPVENFQVSEVIDGVKTEFITSEFSDKLFFVITQISKLGTLVCTSLFHFFLIFHSNIEISDKYKLN